MIRKWLDKIEGTLESEADQLGLLQHGGLVGSSREFIIRRVLRRLLPRSTVIATGRIIDSEGKSSRQVDVIVFDSRFPSFEVDTGIGMYPIEGVIATIEVKSNITKTTLKESLDNTRSILSLSLKVEEPCAWGPVFSKKMKLLKDVAGEDQARRRMSYEFMPASYVFSFSSSLSARTMASEVDDWYTKMGRPTCFGNRVAVLPRVVVAKNNLGLLNDGLHVIDPGDDVNEQYRIEHGEGAEHLMSFVKYRHRFGILISHLMYVVSNRMGTFHGSLGVKYGFKQYLPGNEYFREMKGLEMHNFCMPGPQNR